MSSQQDPLIANLHALNAGDVCHEKASIVSAAATSRFQLDQEPSVFTQVDIEAFVNTRRVIKRDGVDPAHSEGGSNAARVAGGR